VGIALDRPSGASLLTQWTVQPVALVLVVALAGAYWVGVRRLAAVPRGRVALFVAGLVLLLWTSTGFPAVYNASLFWVWTSQILIIWLVVPTLLLAGNPIDLTVLHSRPLRALANPLVGPALLPILSGVLFFGPLPAWAIETKPVEWVLQLVLLVVGGLMVLPLVGPDEHVGSLAVGLSLAIGSFELVLDALPGVILRLHSGLATSWFDHRAHHSWTPAALHDQQIAGAIVWCVAEVIDLPFLLIVYRRWLRSDAREAAEIDTVLEAERIARGTQDAPGAPAGDAPWWLSDPEMQERLKRQG
jgi:cytochrome c oxidase assembly factor CtaG